MPRRPSLLYYLFEFPIRYQIPKYLSITLSPMDTKPCFLCTSSLLSPQLITRALSNRYQSITNIIYFKRVSSATKHQVLLNDLIDFNSEAETLALYFTNQESRVTFQKQIQYLRHHTDYPKTNVGVASSEILSGYRARKRMLKFIHLSKILNIQLDNDAFSITSIILEMQGREGGHWDKRLRVVEPGVGEGRKEGKDRERSTVEQTQKRTVKKKGKSKSKGKESPGKTSSKWRQKEKSTARSLPKQRR